MRNRIDSTLYYFQYLIARILIIGVIGFLIYSIIRQEIGATIFCSIFVVFGSFMASKHVPKPSDLKFDKDFLYLDNQSNPIKLKNIESFENGIISYSQNGKTSKIRLPNFYFIDKNYHQLKKTIENKSTNTEQQL